MKSLVDYSLDPSLNLALEDVILKSFDLGDEPVFRIWQNRPSVIIGTNQFAEQEVNIEYCQENDIPIVRRMTGGGAVYHDLGNLNYSFFFPSGDVSFMTCYEIMKDLFLSLGVEIEMSSTNDLLLDGRKFSGMAKQIHGKRTLIHGTILYDVDFARLSMALDNSLGKFNQKRGIRSRHAEVVNIKPYLKFDSIESLMHFIESYLSGGDERLKLDDPMLHDANILATSRFENLIETIDV